MAIHPSKADQIKVKQSKQVEKQMSALEVANTTQSEPLLNNKDTTHANLKSAQKVSEQAPEKLASNTNQVKKTPIESSKTSEKAAVEPKSGSAKKSSAIKQATSDVDSVATPAETSVGEAPKVEAKSAAVKQTKQVIVPSKPPINPKPVAEKKTETDNSNVVIPKTSTNKMVDYAPEFIKSVLDTPSQTPSSPTMRYSDSELNEFRELINKKLEAAKKELAYLQGLITRKDEMGGDESDNRYMTMEDGSMSMEREQLSQMASRQITFIDHLEKAIMRIENKTYGICRVTGKLIDKARLRAVPHATLSMEAKLGIVK